MSSVQLTRLPPPVGRAQHYSIQQSGVTKNLIGASLVKSVSISLHLDLNSTFHPNSLKCFIKDISHIFSSRQIKRNVCVNVVKWWFRCELEWSITCYCLLTLKQQRKMLFIYQFNLLYIYILWLKYFFLKPAINTLFYERASVGSQKVTSTKL